MRPVGGAVSVTEVLHNFVYDARHVIWKVEISDTNVTYRFPSGSGAMAASKKAPELKLKGKNHGCVVLLAEPKIEAQKYLRQFAGDTEVFNYQGTLVKDETLP
jgi:hypothetical protein